jgi:hypothetical protein
MSKYKIEIVHTKILKFSISIEADSAMEAYDKIKATESNRDYIDDQGGTVDNFSFEYNKHIKSINKQGI